MSLLLDTNVLSELRKGERMNANVARWAATQSGEQFTSVLVIGELRRGIELKRHHDVNQAAALDSWLESTIRKFGDRILAIDGRIADRWGRLGIPDRLPAIDGLIAATALIHGLTLVTRDRKDMVRAGVKLIDPFVV